MVVFYSRIRKETKLCYHMQWNIYFFAEAYVYLGYKWIILVQILGW